MGNRITLSRKSGDATSANTSGNPIKPFKKPITKVRMRPAAEALLDMQYDLGTDYDFIEVELELPTRDIAGSHGARLMETAYRDCIDITVPKPINAPFSLDYMKQWSEKQIVEQMLIEGELIDSIYKRLVATPDGGALVTVSHGLLSWICDQENFSVDLSRADETGTICLMDEIREQAVYPALPELGELEQDGGPHILDPAKLPKGLLFNGRPSRDTFSAAVLSDNKVAWQYSAIVFCNVFEVWMNQLKKLRSEVPAEWSTSHRHLKSWADEATMLRDHSRKRAEKEAKQKDKERAIKLNAVLADRRIELSLQHGFECHDAIEAALIRYWLMHTKDMITLPDASEFGGFDYTVSRCVYCSDDLADQAAAWNEAVSPSLATLTILDRLTEYFDTDESARTLIEGRQVGFQVAESEGRDFVEMIVIDGLLKPRSDSESRFLTITIQPTI